MQQRTFWFFEGLDDPASPTNIGAPFKAAPNSYEGDPSQVDRFMVTEESQANLVSSLTTEGMHMPVIDIDVPVRLVPSKTPGHGHLFIDKPLTKWKYFTLLRALVDAGIVEPNYYRAAVQAGMTFVRKDPQTRPERG